MRRDVPRTDGLGRAIDTFERAARRRQVRPAAVPPPPTRPARPSLRLRYELVAVGVSAAIVSAGFLLTGSWSEPIVTVAPAAAGRQATAVARVVLDPGHGGHDPGAGTGKLREAALVLDIARRLRERLTTETFIDVVLTRQDDRFVPLPDRVALANRVGADLFLSIHANASRNRLAGGIATYHVGSGRIRGASAASPAGSRALATLVQRSLVRRLRRVYPEVRDLGVKPAGFEVLVGARMPGVLAEISFLSNAEEAALLSTETYRDRISDALFESIVAFQPATPARAAVADD